MMWSAISSKVGLANGFDCVGGVLLLLLLCAVH